MLDISPMFDEHQVVAVTVESKDEAVELCEHIMLHCPQYCEHWDNDHNLWDAESHRSTYILNHDKVRRSSEFIIQHTADVRYLRRIGALLIPFSSLKESAELDEISEADFLSICT